VLPFQQKREEPFKMPILKKRRKVIEPERDEEEEIEELKQKLASNVPESGSHLIR
jgi:hypothetical protein